MKKQTKPAHQQQKSANAHNAEVAEVRWELEQACQDVQVKLNDLSRLNSDMKSLLAGTTSPPCF